MEGFSGLQLGNREPLRVAAYCRISDREEQAEEGSFENQKTFFTNGIQAHPGWSLAGVFGDYARTGTRTQSRQGFQMMMKRADAGEIDYILTKSISRFSRSAADTLEALRRLTRLGVGVYFLEQGLDSLGGYGEIILTSLATVAEMESEALSENMRMIDRAMNQRGTPVSKACYGYRRQGKEWKIVPEHALRVRLAYLMTAHGYGFSEIAARLNQFEAVDRSGRIWDGRMIRRLLLQEAYIGNLLTNKTVGVRSETSGYRRVPNQGMEDQFYIENHHAPLVSRELWEQLTRMLKEEKLAGQDGFDGVDMLQDIADRDPALDSVRKYLPLKPGRWMALREKRLKEKWKK